MSGKTQRILSASAAGLGLLLAVGVKTFLHPCVHEDGSEALCAGAGELIFLLGLGLFLCGCAAALLPEKYRAVPAAILLILSVLTVLAPGTLKPVCAMAQMRCNLVTRPSALTGGILSGLLSLVLLAGTLRTSRIGRR